MKPGRSKDLVALLATCGALGLGSFLLLRARGALGEEWTDGARRFASASEESMRHAVWDTPERVDALGEARDPALSPDGRLLVFASGERGLNVELFAAELVDGEPREPRALLALNSPADELAPAFANGALYFASDRAGGVGGLDLWRAPYADGQFGAPEALAPGVNSAAEESDPAPRPGTRTLVFSSNRARPDFDLYAAAPDADGFFTVEPLAELNGPREEREPAWTSDGRALYFASDRDGGAGGFDLYRALLFADGWQRARRVDELASARDERGPWTTADGFALYFEGADEAGARLLERARSLELFRLPPPTVTLAQWLTLAALLLLALLALLAKRWSALDILYKCFLASLVLHLLLMLYLRTVVPEEQSYDLGPGADKSFRVRLAPEDGAPSEVQARLGPARAPLAPARERFEPAALEAAPASAALELPERAPEAAPAATALSAEAQSAPAPALAERGEARARYATRAPQLALDAPGPSAAAAPAHTLAGPARVAPSATLLAVAEPTRIELASSTAWATELARGAAPTALERAPAPTLAANLDAPDEHFARSAGAAPELGLDAPPAVIEHGVASAGPERVVLSQSPRGPARPEPSASPLPTALGAPSANEAGPAPRPIAERASEAAHDAVPELRAPSAVAPSRASAPRAEFDAAGRLAPTQREREASSSSSGPARLAAADEPARTVRPEPASASLEVEAGVAGAANAPAFARSSAFAAGGPRLATAPELRAPAGGAALPASTAPKPAFDASAGAGRASGADERGPSAPERAALAPTRGSSGEAPRPSAAPLAAAPASDLAPTPDRAPAPRLSETPYQNRFGAQKLRALEEFGGSAETEHAVAAGLAYLASIQGPGGEWGQRSDAHEKYLDVRVGKSALALLAFLGAGHVPGGSSEHAALVERAVRYLLATQDRDSGHFGRSCSYGHGIATYALAECFALTHDEALRAPLERAVAEILRNQNQEQDPRLFGGFGYYFADGHVWNGDAWPRTSVTAWQVMALESARLGGLAVPDKAFADARTFLLNTWDPNARAFRYDHDPARLNSGYPILPASTPAALFALSLIGVDARAEELAAARRFVLTRAPDGYRFTGADDFVREARGNLYFWYYGTLAMFRVGGREWERWNGALQETLLPAQAEDGSWRPIDTYAEYAGDEDGERTYTTAMCVLSLEIYYRYFTPLLQVR